MSVLSFKTKGQLLFLVLLDRRSQSRQDYDETSEKCKQLKALMSTYEVSQTKFTTE